LSQTKSVSFLSLGCPKALVDSEHIVTQLIDQGYDVVGSQDQASVIVVNTCGFINSAKAQSIAAIETALAEGREVVVTGCMGGKKDELLEHFPDLKHISGPAQVAPVVNAVKTFLPLAQVKSQAGDNYHTQSRVRLTPDHYAYLKISEGCNHTCSFCIIPDMRGRLRSRGIGDVLGEAAQMVDDGVQEILVIAQDLSAYGVDLRYAQDDYAGAMIATRLVDLCEQLGDIAAWIRLHYVYPYPSVDKIIPLMAQGKILPYLDIPLQHASPRILKAMRRPAAAEKSLERIHRWREICPELAIRSTFIVGFPGETDEDVGMLLDFLEAAQLDRVGCFTFSTVAGAAANVLPDQVDERDKLDRQEAVYELQGQISAQRLKRHVGKTLRVLVDADNSAQEGSQTGLVGRTMFDAPEIDGCVYIDTEASKHSPRPGDFAWVHIREHDDHDLFGTFAGQNVDLV